MLKRILSLIFISVLCVSCSKQQGENVTFSSWGSVTEVHIVQNLITNFEKENPDIKINFIHIPQNYFQKIHLLFASNTPPDVLFINNLYLPLYAEKLEDLTQITDTSPFYEQCTNAMTIDGKLLAVPRDISNLVIYYNKNIVSKAPDTIQELQHQIEKYSDKSHFGTSYERKLFYAEPFILTLGYNNGINYYLDLEGKYAPKPSDIGSSTQAQMFLDEKVVFYISGRWMYPKLTETAKFPVGIIPFPGKIYADASGWAISKNSKHKESAKKFVKYISSKESLDYLTTTGLIVPSRKDSAQILDNKAEHAFLDSIKISQKRIVNKDYQKNTDKINKKLFER